MKTWPFRVRMPMSLRRYKSALSFDKRQAQGSRRDEHAQKRDDRRRQQVAEEGLQGKLLSERFGRFKTWETDLNGRMCVQV